MTLTSKLGILRPDVVSVVLVNHDGFDNTIEALQALDALDWPADRLEVIVVDTASAGDDVARLRAERPEVTVLALDENAGFAGGCNRGVDAATGEWVAFLNNDARPAPDWLREAVPVLRNDGVACVASKILDWSGQRIDYVDAALSFYGHGFKLHAGESDDPVYDRPAEVLFASGAAMLVDAEVFRFTGGFDERYFMFFEDVDFGWRLWLQGYRVRYIPTSVVYHRHHATVDRFGPWREHYLLERNALFTIFKNYDDAHLRPALAAALLLAVRRTLLAGRDDVDLLDLRLRPGDEDVERTDVSKETLTGVHAIDAFCRALPDLQQTRHAVQAKRRRSDHEVERLFKLQLFPNIGDESFVHPFNAVVDALGIRQLFESGRKILVATGDVLQPKMAGPAIRALQIAKVLAAEHDVTLVTTSRCTLEHEAFPVRRVSDPELKALVDASDVVVFQGNLMAQHPSLERTDRIVVADIYDPFHLEVLEQARGLPAIDRRFATRTSKEVLNQQLLRGDFFLCASEKQRHFWLGQLAGVGRINPSTYDEHENLHSLIAVVPFGVSDHPPRHERQVLKGVIPGIGADDKVILWGGGIYSWFDPLTLVRAVDKLRARIPNVRLFFLGVKHPNPFIAEMTTSDDTRNLARELGLLGTHVFFNEDWVPYEDRQNYLLEADVGVSTHLDHIETEFSFRTRILDYFWAGLPIVATGGDSLAELIDRRGAGFAVPPADVDRLEEALFRLLDDADLRTQAGLASRALAEEHRWSTALAPLVEFCRAPRRAPDLVDPLMASTIGDPLNVRRFRRRVQRDLGIISEHVQQGDLRGLLQRARRRGSRLFSRGRPPRS